MSESQRIDLDGLQTVLQCILADWGYVDAPQEGCALRTGNIQRDRVAQVAEAVMQQLRQKGVL